MLSHDIILNELRKVYNDLTFIKANLFYPKDIDHGPTENMISVDGITIPKFTKVIQIPDKIGVESEAYRKYADLMTEISLYLARLESVDLRSYQFTTDFNTLCDYVHEELLLEGMKLRNSALEMVPFNFNYHFRKFFNYVKRLTENYAVISGVHRYLKAFEFIDPSEFCTCITHVTVSSVEEWLEVLDGYFEDGLFCITFDDVIKSLRDSVSIMTIEQQLLCKLNYSSVTYDVTDVDFLNTVSNALTESVKVDTTDYHLERSKVPFVPFDKDETMVESMTPELPYQYVHGVYLSNSINPNIYQIKSVEPKVPQYPINSKPPRVVKVSSAIGDITELP